MKVHYLVALAGLIPLVGGCAAVAPLAEGLTGIPHPTSGFELHNQTTLKLEEANFVTVRTNVVGRSKGFKLLGFITLYPATLDKAFNRLYASAEAQEGRPQTLSNVMVENSGSYFILFSIPVVTARADLVEFVGVDESDEEHPKSLKLHPVAHVHPSP